MAAPRGLTMRQVEVPVGLHDEIEMARGAVDA
jgi:hypothetical protein